MAVDVFAQGVLRDLEAVVFPQEADLLLSAPDPAGLQLFETHEEVLGVDVPIQAEPLAGQIVEELAVETAELHSGYFGGRGRDGFEETERTTKEEFLLSRPLEEESAADFQSPANPVTGVC